MSDLPDFLLARIAEDETVARGALDPVEDGTRPWVGVDWNSRLAGDLGREWGPARVLDECDAKRQVVESYLGLREAAKHVPAEQQETARNMYAGIKISLQCLSLPYANNPDYVEAWRP